jgi:L-2-hydroxyglutarate oxidase LhgO
LDLAGRIRFGPDVQWITDPTDYKVSDSHLDEVHKAVSEYLPTIDRDSLAGDYTGIRYLPFHIASDTDLNLDQKVQQVSAYRIS